MSELFPGAEVDISQEQWEKLQAKLKTVPQAEIDTLVAKVLEQAEARKAGQSAFDTAMITARIFAPLLISLI